MALPFISIIIRTKNEEKWIGRCLSAVFNQDYSNFEVIVVDNESNDRTLDIVKKFPCKIITLDKYLPGKSLNTGIKESSGEYLVFLSGHCIPTNSRWLGNLLQGFTDNTIAGVYGRQEPLPETNPFDKRDLLITFGLDRKVQVKDNFFHNANSAIRKSLWELIPFDDTVTNIEDRLWAKNILDKGYKIVYEPEASVFHHHGIHHGRDPERCESTVKIIEKFVNSTPRNWDEWIYRKDKLNVVGIIPLRKEADTVLQEDSLQGRLLKHAINNALNAKMVNRVIVTSDSKEIVDLAKKFGAEAPFIRPEELSLPDCPLEDVLKHAVNWLEEKEEYPVDIVIMLEINHPFRTSEIIDEIVVRLITERMDSVFVGKKEFKPCWKLSNGSFSRVDQGFVPRKNKDPLFIGSLGIGCATLTKFIKEGRRVGDNVGIIEVKDPYLLIDIDDDYDRIFTEEIINKIRGNLP